MSETNKLVEIDHVRERLLKLIGQVQDWGVDVTSFDEPDIDNEVLADHLLDNGVTVVQTSNPIETDRVNHWIPVTERLPELVLCAAGTAYSEAVNVLTTGRKVITAIWDGTDFIGDAEFWNAENEEITHWTPVLLPLPESPDGT